MICPKCNIKMGPTYEPYERRCTKCGYWFDEWTGKEVTFDFGEPDDPPMSRQERYSRQAIERDMRRSILKALDDEDAAKFGG